MKNGKTNDKILLDDIALPEFKDQSNLDRIIGFLNPERDVIALDVGTGAGNIAIKLSDYVKKVYANDISNIVIERILLPELKRLKIENVEPIICDIMDLDPLELPEKERKFDIITCRYIIYYMSDPREFMRKMHDFLNIGGKILITTFFFSPTAKQDWVPISKLREPDIVSYYTKEELVDFIEQQNLSIIDVHTFQFKRSLDRFLQTTSIIPRAKAQRLIKRLSDETKNELSINLKGREKGQFFYYNAIDIIAQK